MNEDAIVRDVRIERIGFVQELGKWANDLKTGVKLSMLDKSAERAESAHFDALLISGTVTRTIDPFKLWKLVKKNQLTEKQFLASVKVSIDAAGEFLSREQVNELADEKPATPQLRIARKK